MWLVSKYARFYRYVRICVVCLVCIHNTYILCLRELPWHQRVFQWMMLVITSVTCVFSHMLKEESCDWSIKDAPCSIYPLTRSVTSRLFSWWDKSIAIQLTCGIWISHRLFCQNVVCAMGPATWLHDQFCLV